MGPSLFSHGTEPLYSPRPLTPSHLGDLYLSLEFRGGHKADAQCVNLGPLDGQREHTEPAQRSPRALGDQPHPSTSLMAGCTLKKCFCRMGQREPHGQGQQDAPWAGCAFIPHYSLWNLPLHHVCCSHAAGTGIWEPALAPLNEQVIKSSLFKQLKNK